MTGYMNRILFFLFLLAGITCAAAPQVTAEISSADPTSHPGDGANWWKSAIIYQVYLRSFKDSNHDGIGDIRGLINRLDYIQNLGATVIYISPHYDSPNVDFGYDIRNYRKISHELGSMHDFDDLVAAVHKRKMKLMIDAVINHTSDQHPWFKKSRSAVTNSYRNYYHWRASQINPPNNYQSIFGGTAWQFDPKTSAYYLHYFSKNQPDINWENPLVRQEIYAILRFWLDKGIDAIRFDSVSTLSKFTDFPSVNNHLPFLVTYSKGPHIHDYLREMHQMVLAHYPNVFTIGELAGVLVDDTRDFVARERKELDAALWVDLVKGRSPLVDSADGGQHATPQQSLSYPLSPAIPSDPVSSQRDGTNFSLSAYRRLIATIDRGVGENGWNIFFISNHDYSRGLSNFGDDSSRYREASAKALGTLLLTQRGTPLIYQGDEIGMTNYSSTMNSDQPTPQQGAQHVATAKDDRSHIALREQATLTNRFASRTPFQWDDSIFAGFSTVKPWLNINPNYRLINAKQNLKDSQSVYHHFVRMAHVRMAIPALRFGDYHDLDSNDEAVLAYTRSLNNATYLVLINFSPSVQVYELPASLAIGHTVIQTNARQNPKPGSRRITLQPWQSGLYGMQN